VGRRGVTAAALVWLFLPVAPARGEPVSGPREVIDNQYTTTEPGAPTGFHYTGRYHAAGDPEGDPPYMRRMRSDSSGQRFDTSVPERCTASDLELALRGAAACPPGSRLGGGTTDGKFMGQTTTLPIDVFNNTDEQIFVISSPFVTTVARGTLHPDGSVEFASPTCFPSVNPPGCPVDNALQLGSDVTVPPYTRDGRSYMTTPPECPAAGHWETPITFWWADGAVDTVVTRQTCSAPAANSA
jgi:hypothetical protein